MVVTMVTVFDAGYPHAPQKSGISPRAITRNRSGAHAHMYAGVSPEDALAERSGSAAKSALTYIHC